MVLRQGTYLLMEANLHNGSLTQPLPYEADPMRQSIGVFEISTSLYDSYHNVEYNLYRVYHV